MYLNHWKRISMDFPRFCCILPLTIAPAIEFSVCSGMGGCLCPISSKMIMMYTSSRAMMYNAANYTSVSDDTTFFIIWDMLRNDPLFFGMVESLDEKKWPPALLRDFGSLR